MIEKLGVGLGLRPEIMKDVETVMKLVDFFEVNITPSVPQYMINEFKHVADNIPVVIHSLALSIGTAEEFPSTVINFLKEVSDKINPVWVSDHLSFSSAGDVEVYSFIPMPYTDEALELLIRKTQELKKLMGKPIILENITHHMRWPHDEYTEFEFLDRLTKAADCGLLLDVTNLYLNSHTFKYDCYNYLQKIDPERIVEVHIAGHTTLDNGQMVDSHVGNIGNEVLQILEWVLRNTSCRGVLIERDSDLSNYEDVLDDIAAVRQVYSKVRGSSNERSRYLVNPR